MQKCSAIARRTAISARFSDTIQERIVSRNAKFLGAKMLRDRTPKDHLGPLFGYHSGAYRFPEREIPGCKNAPQSHTGRPFRLAFRIPFRNVSFPGTRNSWVQKCSAIAPRTAISARFSDTILERIGSRGAARDKSRLRASRALTCTFNFNVGLTRKLDFSSSVDK